MGFLTDVVGDVRRRLDRTPLDASRLMSTVVQLPPARPFASALGAAWPAVIAEVKRASPSAGHLSDREPAQLATAYETGGAAAISVLTEPRHFEGSLADLRAVRLAVRLPVLRKDFLVHPDQLIESRAGGADAVLLIAAALRDAELKAMLAATADLGMEALVEAQTEADLERVLTTEATLVGVNARDLESLQVDARRALELLGRVPPDRQAVLESGIASREDVERATAAGAIAVLVGETLVRSRFPAATLYELRGASAASKDDPGGGGAGPQGRRASP